MKGNSQTITYKQKNTSTGGSSYSKLKALIKKNYLVLKRNKGTTLCEIFFPIGLMILILISLNLLEKIFHIMLFLYFFLKLNNFFLSKL